MSNPICVNCVTGFILPGEPKGKEEMIGNRTTYVTSPNSGNTDSSKKIIFFTDVFGLFKNIKLVADMVADRCGYTVLVPDVSTFHRREVLIKQQTNSRALSPFTAI